MSRLDIVRVVAAVESTLWIGGGQWAGKSTVAHLLSARYPLLRYVYDYHDARSHTSRARSEPTRFPSFDAFLAQLERDPSVVWVDATPEQMVEQAEAIFEERFEMVLEDLQAAPGELVVLAEGWGLRPALVAPYLRSHDQAVFLVATSGFRERQAASLERARSVSAPGLSDPRRGQLNRVERDRILGERVVADAERLGLPVIAVDGSEGPDVIASRVEEQFRPLLPTWLY
jgi:hypothetical protein